MELMNQESQEFWEEFASEAREHLASAGSDLLALEKDPADGPKARIDRVFRGMHSIKGGAAFLGLVAVEKLSHSLESLLDLVRKGKCEPRPDLIDLSLRGTDKLQALLDDLAHSDPEQIQDIVLGTVHGMLTSGDLVGNLPQEREQEPDSDDGMSQVQQQGNGID